MPPKKEVYIVGGPNGAGKTTFVKQFLPHYVKVEASNFINADNIARGLSPLEGLSLDISAGKEMLRLIDKYKAKGETFAFEQTLAGVTLIARILKLKETGYKVYIFFLDLVSVELAISRVKYRVESGGHDIPEETIRRRYVRCRRNFWYNYKDAVDGWYLFDNSAKESRLVANSIGEELKEIDVKYLKSFKDKLAGGEQ